MPSPRPRRVLVVVAALAIGAAGCGLTEGAPSAAPSPSPSPATVAVDVAPGTTAGASGARADVGIDDCRSDDGHYRVRGRVSNTGAPADYRVWVALVDVDHDTLAVSDVLVAGVGRDEVRDWSAVLAVTGEDLTCVLRVERSEAV